mgnify:CR=1 FL=1
MENKFIRADDVAQELSVSKPVCLQANPSVE